MARTYLVFGDIEGKLDVLRVECIRCDRKGHYHVHKLIEKHGRKGNMMKWREMLKAELIGTIDSERQHGGLSSVIRLFVLDFYRQQMPVRKRPDTAKT
jgi:hypothetical protein